MEVVGQATLGRHPRAKDAKGRILALLLRRFRHELVVRNMPPAGPPLAWLPDGTIPTVIADNDAMVLLASQFAKLPLSLEVAQAVLSCNTLGSMNKTRASNDEALKNIAVRSNM